MFSAHFVWFLITLGGGVAIAGSVWVVQIATPDQVRHDTWRRRLAGLVGPAIVLGILGALYQVHAVARADGLVVAKTVPDRGNSLDEVFTIVTTMGDLVPCFTIAGVLALLYYQRTKYWTAALLPLIVLVQVVFQQVFLNYVSDLTITQVVPDITLGGDGGIPSGSMARLLSLFLFAAILWRAHDPKVARWLTNAGITLAFIEMITRLYLARHLLADILGGLLLGVILTVAFGWLVYLIGPRSRVDTAQSAA